MNINYFREMEAVIASLEGRRPTLLLHSCCGPCTSAVLEMVTPYFDTTVFFYNPNILPAEEFEKRLYWLRVLLDRAPFAEGVELMVPDRDEPAFWAAARGLEAEPEGGARCTECFELRLSRTARAAKEGGFEFFATTLTVSPHKNAPLINAIGARLGQELGVRWLPSDFKKKDGYRRSIQLSAEYGLYRQAWCGCGLGGSRA
jgi:hypothetical protein